MKKTYQKPEIKIVQIFSQEMMTDDLVESDLLDASMAVEDADGMVWD